MRAYQPNRISVFGIDGLGQDDGSTPDYTDTSNPNNSPGALVTLGQTIQQSENPSSVIGNQTNTTNATTTAGTANIASAIAAIGSSFSNIYKAISAPVCTTVSTPYGTSQQCATTSGVNAGTSLSTTLSSLTSGSGLMILLAVGGGLLLLSAMEHK